MWALSGVNLQFHFQREPHRRWCRDFQWQNVLYNFKMILNVSCKVFQVEQSISLHDEIYKIMHSFKVNLQKKVPVRNSLVISATWEVKKRKKKTKNHFSHRYTVAAWSEALYFYTIKQNTHQLIKWKWMPFSKFGCSGVNASGHCVSIW